MSIEDRQSDVMRRFDEGKHLLQTHERKSIDRLIEEFADVYEALDANEDEDNDQLDDILDNIEEIMDEAGLT